MVIVELDRAPEFTDQLKQTVPAHDASSCLRALRACVDLYRRVRVPPGGTVTVEAAELAVVDYLDDIERRCGPEGPGAGRA